MRKLYRKIDNPKRVKELSCGDTFAREHGWIPAEDAKNIDEPIDKNEKPVKKVEEKEAIKNEEANSDIPEIPEIKSDPQENKESKAKEAKTAPKKQITKRGLKKDSQ